MAYFSQKKEEGPIAIVQQEYTSPETEERDSEKNTQATTEVDEQYDVTNNEIQQSTGVMEHNCNNTENIMEEEHNPEETE